MMHAFVLSVCILYIYILLEPPILAKMHFSMLIPTCMGYVVAWKWHCLPRDPFHFFCVLLFLVRPALLFFIFLFFWLLFCARRNSTITTNAKCNSIYPFILEVGKKMKPWHPRFLISSVYTWAAETFPQFSSIISIRIHGVFVYAMWCACARGKPEENNPPPGPPRFSWERMIRSAGGRTSSPF